MKHEIKRIITLKLEKENNLFELGKVLKSSNMLEIKELNSYLALKTTGKKLAALRIKLEKAEESENTLKTIKRQINELNVQKKIKLKIYYEKLKKNSKIIIEKYPENDYLLEKYKINIKTLKTKKYKNNAEKLIDLNKKTSFLETVVEKIKRIYKFFINKINIVILKKEFNNKVLKENLDNPNLEKLVEEFTGNKSLSANTVSEFISISKIDIEIKNKKNEIKNIISQNNIDGLPHKRKIENDISTETGLNNNILKKIAEEFIEKAKNESDFQKSNQVIILISKIEEIDLNIKALEREKKLNIKKDEIENLKNEMKIFRKEKEIAEKKLNELNTKIASIQKEINNIDNE